MICAPMAGAGSTYRPARRLLARHHHRLEAVHGNEGTGCDRYTRSPDRREVALAERACGETDRLDPPGMLRSNRRLRRGPRAADRCGLHRLLQRTANTSASGQGFAGPSADATARPTGCSANPRRAAPSILPDVAFRRDRDREAANRSPRLELFSCLSAQVSWHQNSAGRRK
jgi:hypothetical protein